MKLIVSYYDLFKILGDIEAQAAQHPSFMVLNRTRVENFNKINDQRVRILRESIQKISMRHCKKHPNGTPVYLVLENGQNSLDFETVELKAAFETEFSEFMAQSIEIFT